MPNETEFVVYITDRDRIRVRFTLEHGVPDRIMVQLECEVAGRWREARRYDNYHGYMHLHVTPWDHGSDRPQRVEISDLRYAIAVLTSDLRASWPAIRARLVADIGAVQDDT